MNVNRQAAIFHRSGKPAVMLDHHWRTWGKHNRPGRFRVWGVIEELHEPDKIMCDFDSKVPPTPPLHSLAHTLGLCVLWHRWDRTRRGWHLVIKIMQKLTPAETIACQAILGSDRARERLNLARAISIRLHPSKFWEKRINILYSRKIKVKPKALKNRLR